MIQRATETEAPVFPGTTIPPADHLVGKNCKRTDGKEKVTGVAMYGADLFPQAADLFAKVVRSEEAHADIVKIDKSAALAVAGVLGVYTHEDIGGTNIHGLIRRDHPALADKRVRYRGDAIAVVVAESERAAEAARDRLHVEYSPLPVIATMDEALASYREAPLDFAIGGGSVPGGMDHLVAGIVMQAAGEDPTAFNYIGYDAGGEAMAGLLSGEIDALSTGFSEAVALAEQGEVRILGVTAPERVAAYDAAPTFAEQGIDAQFVNWRGFFAAPGMPEETVSAYQNLLATMMDTPEWEAVRARMGLVNIFRPGDEFEAFLEAQETQIGDLMRDLGFL